LNIAIYIFLIKQNELWCDILKNELKNIEKKMITEMK